VSDDAYSAEGNMGQYVMIIPSRDVVVVGLGPDPGRPRIYFAELAARTLAALPK